MYDLAFHLTHFNPKHHKHYKLWERRAGENADRSITVVRLRALYIPSALTVIKGMYEPSNTHNMRAITPEAANLFGVIVSSEQERQTSALKSYTAWVRRGILTISPMNLVPPASKHECYQYLLHNTHTCSFLTETSIFPFISDNIVLLSEWKGNRSE